MIAAEDRVLDFLLNYRDPETGECTPTIRTIAENLSLSRVYVQQILRRLRQAGRIEAIERWDDGGFPGNLYPARMPNLYRVIGGVFFAVFAKVYIISTPRSCFPVPETC